MKINFLYEIPTLFKSPINFEQLNLTLPFKKTYIIGYYFELKKS